MLGDLNIAEPKALIAFAGPRVVKQATGKDLPQDLADWKVLLARKLPHYMLPTELLACERMPVSVNFKIDRARLAEIYQALNA